MIRTIVANHRGNAGENVADAALKQLVNYAINLPPEAFVPTVVAVLDPPTNSYFHFFRHPRYCR